MNEADYIGSYTLHSLAHGNRTPNYVIAGIIEDYVANMNQPFWVLAEKYSVSVSAVSDFISTVLLNRVNIPVVITLKSNV